MASPPKSATPGPSASSPAPASPTSSASSTRPSRIPLPQLKASVQQAVNARNNEYGSMTAIIVYWEDDDTGAEADANRLEETLQNLLGLAPLKFKILKNTRDPTWDVTSVVMNTLLKGHGPAKLTQTLFIFAYIGHGAIDYSGGMPELILGDNIKNRNVRWQMIRQLVHYNYIDFLGILDCCHAGLKATRDRIPQTVEVLAACGPEETRSRHSRVTFTQRLCSELQRVEQYQKSTLTTELLFERLRNNTAAELSHPRLLHYGGIRPILLNLKPLPRFPSSVSGRLVPPSPDAQHILTRVILTSSEDQSMEDFEEVWLRLPPPFYAQLIDAFKTDDNSVMILARMTWQTWARLSAVLDLDPIGAVIGKSLLC